MSDAPASIDAYVATFPLEVQKILEEIRRRMHAVVPGAEERISYQIPTLTIGGKNFVHFAGWSKYVSLYPVPDNDAKLTKDLAPYQASKGTLKFPLGEPVPYELIERVAVALAARREAL